MQKPSCTSGKAGEPCSRPSLSKGCYVQGSQYMTTLVSATCCRSEAAHALLSLRPGHCIALTGEPEPLPHTRDVCTVSIASCAHVARCSICLPAVRLWAEAFSAWDQNGALTL